MMKAIKAITTILKIITAVFISFIVMYDYFWCVYKIVSTNYTNPTLRPYKLVLTTGRFNFMAFSPPHNPVSNNKIFLVAQTYSMQTNQILVLYDNRCKSMTLSMHPLLESATLKF